MRVIEWFASLFRREPVAPDPDDPFPNSSFGDDDSMMTTKEFLRQVGRPHEGDKILKQ